MSCSVTERVTDNRAGVVGPQAGAGPAGATVTVTATGCRLRGTGASNASLAASPNSRGNAPISTPPQNGPQTGPQSAPLRSKPCCLLWCCCCKCPCSNPGGKANDENGPTRNSNNSDLLVNCEAEPPPSLEEIRSWGRSFDKLMRSPAGREIFRDFLRGEYSEENILFWLACEELKRETNPEVIEEKARIIYEDYISILSPKEVSLDSRVREIVNRNMVEPTPRTFDEAQLQIYTLMHRDSYPRFVNSPLYRSLSQQQTSTSGPQSAVTTAMVTVSSGDQDG
ncbi:regulator of G-protein signaling 20 [Anoplophora glabripennis]|uniref:regulator of G-protein signaling 20 n=2 Tax=Anoplophora glabripennis TaxID=217634 RepID=UPI000C791BD4|nr:regulator of G-protein signaling 20 [Anoplophora glabripennis]